MKSAFSITHATPAPMAAAITLIMAAVISAIGADPLAETKTSPQSRVIFSNGDKISGQPESIHENRELLFNSINLDQNAHFPLTNILSLQLNGQKKPAESEAMARVQLHPRFNENQGDIILGELKELTPEGVKLDTWYGGIITLKRSMVKSLNIINVGKGHYYGPNSIDEWTLLGDQQASGDKKSIWHFSNNHLLSHGPGGIGKDIGLSEKSHISFEAAWKKKMQFKLLLYSSGISSITPTAYYELSINSNYAYMRTKGALREGVGMRGGGRWQKILTTPTENHAHFDILTERKTGTIHIYINGNRACMLKSQNPNPNNLGTGLIFIAEQQEPTIKISNISVNPWNGTTFPDFNKTLKKTARGDQNQAPHRITLTNGDEVPGTVGVVKDDRMIIQTEHTPIRIPIEKIKSLSLGSSNEEPKKYREDVRAWFRSGGFITLKLTTMTNNTISGFNQALGDVTIDLSAFRRIDFHIYKEQANETREKMRL